MFQVRQALVSRKTERPDAIWHRFQEQFSQRPAITKTAARGGEIQSESLATDLCISTTLVIKPSGPTVDENRTRGGGRGPCTNWFT